MSNHRKSFKIKELRRRMTVVLYGIWMLAIPYLATSWATPAQAHGVPTQADWGESHSDENSELVIRCRRRTLRGLRALAGEPDYALAEAVIMNSSERGTTRRSPLR